MKYSIGLDIGIASVGWSIIRNDSGYIEDLGVRLFEARNSDNNLERRTGRGSRRLLRRRKTRLSDAKKFLKQHDFHENKQLEHTCPYTLRVMGLTEKLTRDEIYKVIMHILKKRGIAYLDEEDTEVKTNGKEYANEVIKNAELQKELTPGQIQLNRLNKKGKVRSGINAQGEYQLNIFTVGAYAEELKQILDTQREYYPEISEEFMDFFLKKSSGREAGLIYRKRPYYHGPGNENNPSEYGRWVDYPKTGKPAENIFDKLIGTDILGERRASSLSITAQKYNLLNDLNNLRLPNETGKISVEQKEKILNILISQDVSSFGPTQVAKELGYKVNEIKGWRLNKSDKPEIHSMKSFRNWKKVFAENNLDINSISDDILDKIAMIVTLNTDKDAVVRTLAIELPELDNLLRDIVINNFQQLKKSASGSTWHNFSLKTLHKLIPELIHTSDEQNTILERMGLKFDLRNKYSNLTKIPVNELLEEIYNPTVSKSVRQSIKVLNALVAKYGKENISHVTIEMPRDKNEKDQQNTIKKIQKSNEERHKKSHQFFIEKSGWTEERFESELRRPSFAKKLLYYYEQDAKCAYSGKPIQPEDLLKGITEIDHIIPLSISLDDSLNNKVLVLAQANQEKGQRTPYQAFQEGAQLGQTWEMYKTWVCNNSMYKKINIKRIGYYLRKIYFIQVFRKDL